MIATYERSQEIANTQLCVNCRDRGVLVVRHTGARDPRQVYGWEVYCPNCGERENFYKPESLTQRWWQDPGSVNVAVANRLAKRHEAEIESVAEGLPGDLATAVRAQYLPDTANTKESGS